MNTVFVGNDIVSHNSFTGEIFAETIPVIGAMGRNVNINNATINIDEVMKELARIGYTLNFQTKDTSAESLNIGDILGQMYGMFREMFEQDVRINKGEETVGYLMNTAMNNGEHHSEGTFLGNVNMSNGHYSSYQLCFYSKKMKALCFIILCFGFFRIEVDVIGIPVWSESRRSSHIQVFKIEKVNKEQMLEYINNINI